MKIYFLETNADCMLVADDAGEIRYLDETGNEVFPDSTDIEAVKAFTQAVEDTSSWHEYGGTIEEILSEGAILYEVEDYDGVKAKDFAQRLYDEGWREDDLEQVIADFNFTRLGAEYIVSLFKDFEPKYWYALQNTSEDAWDNGTFDKDEAIDMLLNNEEYNLIAVIENDTCIEEIHKDNI